MNEQEKRIKIAEARGYVLFENIVKGDPDKRQWFPPNKSTSQDSNDLTCLPDYFRDLNACREMVTGLTNEQRFDYVYALNDELGLVPLGSPASFREVVLFEFLNATAAQRCEAFGRTLNLW